MSVLRRLANAGAAVTDAARAVPRPVFAPVSGAAVLGDAASDRWDAAHEGAGPGSGESAPSPPADRRDSSEPAFDPDRSDARARVTATPREANEPRPAGGTIPPLQSRPAPVTAGTMPSTEPDVSIPGDITSAIRPAAASDARPDSASDVTMPQTLSGESLSAAPVPTATVVDRPDESGHATTEPSPLRPTTDAAAPVETSANVETGVRPRSPADASWLDRARSPAGDGGSADDAPDRSGFADGGDAVHPIEVRIGTIEVFEAAEASSSGRHGSLAGFAEYAAVRSYDWGDHG